MQVSSSHQGYVFLLFILMGMVCGMIFDTQRFFRKKSFAGTVRTTIEDVIFAILTTGIMIAASFVLNDGEIRYYQGMGAVSGMLFYAAFLSGFFQKIISVLCSVTVKLIVAPLVKTCTFSAKIIKNSIAAFRKHFIRIKRKFSGIKRRIKKRRKIIKKRVKML